LQSEPLEEILVHVELRMKFDLDTMLSVFSEIWCGISALDYVADTGRAAHGEILSRGRNEPQDECSNCLPPGLTF
jgi:hypothetical protein